MPPIELLAPAKDYAAAVAAVDCGADALYIGGAKFGARQAAGNSTEQIARVTEYAHRFGVRVHATLNTLLFDDELEEAERQARELLAAGVDALIVQDMAYLRMNLGAELHASTQVCNTSPAEAAFLGRCGFARIILERALSLEEIRRIRQATDAELECFVHGAICVGYSGRCFLSRSTGSRSGNRGACSQPCRLPYDLQDAAGRTLVQGKHLLSVRDLNLSARLGELLDAGVSSFKIEGRLKDVNYIRNVVSHYRRELDRALAERPALSRASAGVSRTDFRPDPAKSFTRGDTEYFLDGRCRGVASFDTPKSVGEYLGRVAQADGRTFRLDRPCDAAPGDGLCFLTSEGLCGTNVNAVEGDRLVPNRMEGIGPGTAVYRNFDRRFTLLLERSRTRRVIPASAEVTAGPEGVRMLFRDREGVMAEVARVLPLEPAAQPERMAATIHRQVARSGDTPFEIGEVRPGDGAWFVPAGVLNDLRREGLELLLRRRLDRPRPHRILPEDPAARCPRTRLTAEENVTNALAERFYRDHGVAEIERGLDLAVSTAGCRVMRSAYCIRREIGACLRVVPAEGGDLFLVRGRRRYRLLFDCERCEMSLIDAGGKAPVDAHKTD